MNFKNKLQHWPFNIVISLFYENKVHKLLKVNTELRGNASAHAQGIASTHARDVREDFFGGISFFKNSYVKCT